MFLRGVFRSANDHGEKRICDIRHDHADGVGFLFGQAARDQVWTIIQFPDGFFDSIAKFLADVALLIDHLGYRKYRDAGFARHIVDAGGLTFIGSRLFHSYLLRDIIRLFSISKITYD